MGVAIRAVRRHECRFERRHAFGIREIHAAITKPGHFCLGLSGILLGVDQLPLEQRNSAVRFLESLLNRSDLIDAFPVLVAQLPNLLRNAAVFDDGLGCPKSRDPGGHVREYLLELGRLLPFGIRV